MFEKLAKFEKRYEELEGLLATPEVLAHQELCNKYAKELSDLREPVFLFREHKRLFEQVEELKVELSKPHDKDFMELIQRELPELAGQLTALEGKLKRLLTGEDKDLGRDVMVEIRGGTGGREASLFAADLYRMYTQYALSKGWKVESMVLNETELGGLKEVVFSVQGKDVYKRLKWESGVHRVQRVPETESQGRIHTSTATVAIMVEPEDIEFVIENKDLRIDTYRSSGPGGQHMQKTDSAVRITHVPTSTVVTCQDERSQIKNKAKAMRILRARILDNKQQQDMQKIAANRRAQVGSGDRSEKIRTYNFPDRRVTDHRINLTLYRLEQILDGDLDELSDGLIKAADEAKENAEREKTL